MQRESEIREEAVGKEFESVKGEGIQPKRSRVVYDSVVETKVMTGDDYQETPDLYPQIFARDWQLEQAFPVLHLLIPRPM